MKIVKYYYSEAIARFDAEEAKEKERNSNLTAGEREVEQTLMESSFQSLLEQMEHHRELHPYVQNEERLASFEKIASLALEYARFEEIDISVDFDGMPYGVITMETSYLQANNSDRRKYKSVIPFLMEQADEYTITAGNDGQTYRIQFDFLICDEL